MSVLSFKPHHLWTCVTTPKWVDDDGNVHPGSKQWSRYCKCDIVPAGQANTKDFGDGVVQTYAYTIYLPTSCRDFELGEQIRLEKFGKYDESNTYVVKGFHRYQHQCKIWI